MQRIFPRAIIVRGHLNSKSVLYVRMLENETSTKLLTVELLSKRFETVRIVSHAGDGFANPLGRALSDTNLSRSLDIP